jgi:hypothetical protein
MQIMCKAGKLPDALAQLQKRKEAAKADLVKLGAQESSIVFDPPAVGSGGPDEEQRIEMMMRMQMETQGRFGPDKPKVSPPITISTSLTAEWPVKATSPEELLIWVHELREKIKAADLSGLEQQKKEISEEEEELAEEMEEQMNSYRGYMSEGQPKPGEPTFLYVSQVSEEDRTKALTEAFQKAKASAQRLAKAAGVTLGPLRGLNSHMNPSYDEHSGMNAYVRQYMYRYMQQGPFGQASETEEAIGVHPGPVKLGVIVTASFALKPNP